MASADDLAASLLAAIGENDEESTVTQFLSTGYPELDYALSARWDGGLPVGRIVEIAGPPSSGKTAIATEAMAAAQKMGGVAGFMDHERSFSLRLAPRLGLDVTPGRFVFKKPRTFEESITLCVKAAAHIREKKLIAADAPICWVFDSLASMVPMSALYDQKTGKEKTAEERSMHDNTALARATSAHMPAFAQHCEELGVNAIFLNQTRTKLGVCFHYKTKVTLADGSKEWIGKLVHARRPFDVLTMNEQTGKVEVKTVTQFHRNKMDHDHWIHIVTDGGANGRNQVLATPDHPFFTKRGQIKAADLTIEDQILTIDRRYYSEEQHEIILGSLLGDGQIRFEKDGPRGHLRLTHGFKQKEYCDWKARCLGTRAKDGKNFAWANSERSLEFGRYKSVKKFKALLEVPDEIIEKITPRAAAIWFLDDGHHAASKKYGEGKYLIAAKKLSADNLERIAARFESLGMGRPSVIEGKGLMWSGERAALFGRAIAPYVPRCMEYKLNFKIAERCEESLASISPGWEVYACQVLEVKKRPVDMSAGQERYKFDIGVEDNHNFLAGGLLAHNCYGDPRTTPGGDAPKFYASIRIMLGSSKITKSGSSEALGSEITANIIKNKVARPFLTAKWRFMFEPDGTGKFDKVRSTLDFLDREKALEKSGNYIVWKGGKFYAEALAKKIEAEGDWPELLKLLPRKYEPEVVKIEDEAA